MAALHPARRDHHAFVGRDAYLALDDGHYSRGTARTGRSRRRWRRPSKAVLRVVAAATAVVGSVSVYGFGGPWSPEGAVRLYTGALHIEDFEGAWNLLCRSSQAAHGSAFRFHVRNLRLPGETPHPHVLVDGQAQWDEAGDAWVVPVGSSPPTQLHTSYVVVEEDGEFRVCGLR